MTNWHYFTVGFGSLAVYAGVNKQKCAQNKVVKFFTVKLNGRNSIIRKKNINVILIDV